jgi:ribokinase
MRILNFGSVNIDHVYQVPHFVRPGETLASTRYDRFAGGKGFNQSVALARAGAEVHHAGRIGADGAWLRHVLAQDGANVRHLEVVDGPTGHAIIQVDAAGQNCIVLSGGANRTITADDAAGVLADFGAGDLLLLQNEISALSEIMHLAAARGLKIAFNPAPMGAEVLDYPLELVDLFIVNEVEAAGLCGKTADPASTLRLLRGQFPKAHFLLTLGPRGAMAMADGEPVAVPPRDVPVVDTTAAGDTFIGYFLATRTSGVPLRESLVRATIAASLCVSRPGASPSIPARAEVDAVTDFAG